MRMQQVRQLMGNDVSNAHLRSLDELGIEQNALLADLATAPALAELPVDNLRSGDAIGAKAGVYFVEDEGKPIIGALPVPGGKRTLRGTARMVGMTLGYASENRIKANHIPSATPSATFGLKPAKKET